MITQITGILTRLEKKTRVCLLYNECVAKNYIDTKEFNSVINVMMTRSRLPCEA